MRRGTTTQVIRRFVQTSVFALLAAMALLSLYAHYRAARVIDDDQLMAGLRGELATKWIHPLVEKLDDPQAFLDGNQGSVWSMRLLGVSISDPLAAAETIAATGRVYVPLVVSILLPVVLTVLLGRVFCSWICPGYVLFEIAGKLRRVLGLAEIRTGDIRFSHNNKYIVLAAGLAIAMVFSAPLFVLVYPPAVISRAVHAWIFGTELAGMLLILGGIVAFEVFVSPRWWCRTVCPGGALYGLLGWARPLRVRLDREACTGCRECIAVCEAGINPITRSDSIECDNCGVCIRHCAPAALRFAVAPPRPLASVARRRRRSRGTIASRTSQAILVAVVVTAAAPASAHHVLGLPHYSYKENYPQRPTLEYPATSGPWDILFTSYPGAPVPREPANLAFYIKNRDTGTVYARAVTVRVLETSTFGDNTTIVDPLRVTPFDNEHEFQCTFPDDGEYVVELTLDVEGREEVIPFLVVAGEPTALFSVILAILVAAVAVFVVVRIVHRSRVRGRRAMEAVR